MDASRDGGGTCIACHGPLQSIGVERFRVGGTTGAWKLLFGERAELGADLLPFEVLACTPADVPNSGCRRAAPKKHYTARRMGRARG
jgi:hypothetical protein